MFLEMEKLAACSTSEVIALANEAVRSGRLRPGDRFPSSDEISKLTGASLVESLDAITSLLRSGTIRQLPSGQFAICRKLVC
jgi:DNA-binding FadR family transcriptional regulator